MSCALAVCAHDLLRFLRNPGRILHIALLPLVLLVLLSIGYQALFADNLRLADNYYGKWLLPGIFTHILLNSARTSASVMMRDRDTGLLSLMLLSSRRVAAVITGKVLSGTLQCVGYGVGMLVFAGALQISMTWSEVGLALVLTAVGSTLMVSGFYMGATVSKSHEQFLRNSQITIIVLFYLAGSVFPVTNLEGVFYWIGWANPLTWYVDGLRNVMLAGEIFSPYPVIQGFGADFGLVSVFALVALTVLMARFSRWMGMA